MKLFSTHQFENRPLAQGPAGQEGFTLVELLLAMAVFSFMLLIIVIGFMNIVRMHNQAVASNQAQDSARTAMDELVLAVRDSVGVLAPAAGQPASHTMCLTTTNGQQQYSVVGNVLVRADSCGATPASTHQVTSDAVKVFDFTASVESGAGVTKPQVLLNLTVGSSNGTANINATTGKAECGDSQSDRTFCSVITLTSRAVQR